MAEITTKQAARIVADLRRRETPIYAGAGLRNYVVNSEPDRLCWEAADLIEHLLAALPAPPAVVKEET